MKKVIIAAAITLVSFGVNAKSYGPDSSQFICAAAYKALGDKLYAAGEMGLWKQYYNKGNDLFEQTTAGDADWGQYKTLKNKFANTDKQTLTKAIYYCQNLYPTN